MSSPERVYRIVSAEAWERAQHEGCLTPNAFDAASGFMHLSARDEVLESARRYFSAASQPMALEIPTHRLGAELVWEQVAARGNVAFPHLYATEVNVDDVSAVFPLRPANDGSYTWGSPHCP